MNETGTNPPAETNPPNSLRVMVVDDSAFMRFSITQQLAEDPEIQVVGTASNGQEALRLIPELQPDVITLDVEMPRLDGLSTLREIMKDFPRPVIMFSSLTREGTSETVQALMLGAVDFIPKPANRLDVKSVMGEIISKVKQAARAKVKPAASSLIRSASGVTDKQPEKTIRAYNKKAPVVLIGSSTGGPGALSEIIPALPPDLPSPILIVQHMPAGFTRSLSERLNSISRLKVKEAKAGDPLMAGQVLIAPGGFHMTVDENRKIALNQKPAVHGVRPAVDVTSNSIVQQFGGNAIGVILTGMGSDGMLGMCLMHGSGGYVIAEHESTCVVWGMPRSVVEAGAASAILPRPQIPQAIESAIREMAR